MVCWPRLDFVVLCAAFCFSLYVVLRLRSSWHNYFDFSEEEAWRCCLVWCSGILFLLVLEAIPVELMAMPSIVFCLDYCSFCLGVSCLFVCWRCWFQEVPTGSGDVPALWPAFFFCFPFVFLSWWVFF